MKQAFSLVELSIVLVILGLLTGGILAGQSLIRAAELRSVSTEFSRYSAAIHAFRDKYFAIPGDMNNAVSFWNRQVNQAWCLPTSGATVTTPGTCNGNNDSSLQGAGAASQSGEMFQFWRQLALAGLIEGEFSGNSGTGGTTHAVIGTNVPVSRLSNAGWTAFNNVTGGDVATYNMTYTHAFIFGAASSIGSSYTGIIGPEEAWNIDTKLDDGRPAYGKIIARYWNDACAINNSGALVNTNFDASYKLSSTATACALYFNNVY